LKAEGLKASGRKANEPRGLPAINAEELPGASNNIWNIKMKINDI